MAAVLPRREQVEALPTGIDTVWHLAALNGTQNFYERPFDVVCCSTLPTIFLAEHYGRSGGLRRFLYAGTSEAYAATVARFGWPLPTDESVPLCIDDPANPRWSYAASKLHGEIATIQGGNAFGFEWSVARFHNAYGPRMGDKHIIPDFYDRMKQGRYELYGHADTRSFLYIDDAVRATIAVGETPACANEIIHIGSDEEIVISDLARRMMALRGVDAPLGLHPSPKGSVARRLPDISKLKALTGYERRVTLDRGLEATARFYLDGELPAMLD